MSPLVNSLFAFGCAALLATAYGSGCSEVGIGDYTDTAIPMQRYTLSVGQRDAVLEVPDYCVQQNMGQRVGEKANACDYVVAPDVHLGPAFSPVTVHRNGPIDDTGYVDIIVYCR